jgi:hypothetical protein
VSARRWEPRLPVSCALACVAGLLAEQAVHAQPAPFGIIDNSFLVEEAFNQDAGTFQNILSWTRNQSGEWEASFTQEWPVLVTRHQLSYSVPLSGGAGAGVHLGSVQVNYRYQAANEGPRNPAFAPRVSVIFRRAHATMGGTGRDSKSICPSASSEADSISMETQG